jgi:hypothetical protein
VVPETRNQLNVWRLLQRGVTAAGKLTEDLRAVRMHRFRDSAQSWDDGRVPGVDELARHLAGGMHSLTLDDD